MRCALPLLAILILNDCDAPTASVPDGARRFAPPDVYRQWWALTQSCSGLRGNFDAISWYVVEGAATVPGPGGQRFEGVFQLGANRIVLAGAAQHSGDLVRHEMLHALLRGDGHPRQAFVARCGNVVVCAADCLSEAGAALPPDPAVALVTPSALEVTVELEPERPGAGVNGGHFIMWVVARNPTGLALRVALPPSGDAGPSGSFGYRLEGDGVTSQYDMRAEAPEVTRFAAGEAKRFAFDFVVGAGGTRYDIVPGTYRFAGAYGDVWVARAPVATVSP
jgi:hypothetical protein